MCNENKLSTIPNDIGSLCVLEVMRLDNNDLETLPSSIGEIVSTIANLIVWWWHRFPHDSSAISMTLPRYTDSPHLKDLHRFPN